MIEYTYGTCNPPGSQEYAFDYVEIRDDKKYVGGVRIYLNVNEKYCQDFGTKGKENVYIAFLNISEEYRGNGIGRKLIKDIKEKYKDKNIFLHVLVQNSPAVNLYESEGFEFVDIEEKYGLMKLK